MNKINGMNNFIFRKEKIGHLVYDISREETFLVNNIGKLILGLLIKGFSQEEILLEIIKKYDVSKTKAKEDLKFFLFILNSK